jgi:ATP-dependent DNA ligase
MEVGKKERSNYFSTIEAATTNKMWLPMLCPAGMKWDEYREKVKFPGLVSNKLDGARCNIMLIDGEIKAFTRKGKLWTNFDHLVKDEGIKALFKEYPDIILDGEAYNHDYRDRFEDLMSIFKKQTPTQEQREFSAANSKYHIYDIYIKGIPDTPAINRQRALIGVFNKFLKGSTNCVYEKSVLVTSNEEYDKFHTLAMDCGYEGSIFRVARAPYDVDKRSKSLLKRKDTFDCEFIVTDIVEMEGHIAGSVVIDLSSATGDGSSLTGLDISATQSAGMAKGWDDDKCRELLLNAKDHIGTIATIEHFGVTKHGKLRFPKIKAFRNYE